MIFSYLRTFIQSPRVVYIVAALYSILLYGHVIGDPNHGLGDPDGWSDFKAIGIDFF
jgi:hypothetical protein